MSDEKLNEGQKEVKCLRAVAKRRGDTTKQVTEDFQEGVFDWVLEEALEKSKFGGDTDPLFSEARQLILGSGLILQEEQQDTAL